MKIHEFILEFHESEGIALGIWKCHEVSKCHQNLPTFSQLQVLLLAVLQAHVVLALSYTTIAWVAVMLQRW